MAPGIQEENLNNLAIDPAVRSILSRLRNIFHQPQLSCLTTTELHDLTCFVVHKLLLLSPPSLAHPIQSAASECLRYALVLYMLAIHGTTYYSQHHLVNTILLQLKGHYVALVQDNYTHGSLKIWTSSIATMATINPSDRQWFMDQARAAAISLGLHTWEDVLPHLDNILWVRTQHEAGFRKSWEEIISEVH